MKMPTLFQSIIPIVILFTLIIINIITVDDSLAGANQLSLILSAFVAGLIAIYNKVSWQNIMSNIISSFSSVVPAIIILMLVGALSSAWMASGIIPTMIYYGLEILRPEYFLPATVVITSFISVVIGSSWSTIATVGVALIGIGNALGFDPAWTAGAIISGAYFGDKISPLSDTTNLAAGIAKVDLFVHIRFMMNTTLPSIIISIIVFTILGIGNSDTVTLESINQFKIGIKSIYNINGLFLLIPLVTIFMIIRKISVIPVLMIGTILGIISTAFFQNDFLSFLNLGKDLNYYDYYYHLTKIVYGETLVVSGNNEIDELFSTNGIAGMLNTIWLIITAMVFSGVMEAGKFLDCITKSILSIIKTRFSLVSTTVGSCVLANLVTSDQYISIIVPGKMFGLAYEKKKYDSALLSRTLEDSATVTSVLVPWNTCGATQSTMLGVATIAYLPYAIFCWISPLMTLVLAWFNIAQRRKNIK